MFNLIDRYIFREILIPFGLTLATLLLILLTDQLLRLVELLINKGIPLLTIINIFIWLLPPFLIIAIPAGVLIGVIVAFNRLSTDSEIIAIQAIGTSLYRLLRPVILFSTFAFIVTFSLSIWVQPWAGRSLTNLGISLVKHQMAVALEAGMFNEPFKKMVVYIEEMPNPTTLRGIFIYDLRNAEVPVLTLAKEGSLSNDPESNFVGFQLLNGNQYRFDQTSRDRQQLIHFGSYRFKVDLTSTLHRKDYPAGRLSLEDLRKAIIEKPERATTLRRLLGEYYQNYAVPFSCFIFGLLGVPIGIAVRHAGRLGSFAVGLFMGLIYYILIIAADFLSASGTIIPMIAAWIPNLVMAIVAFTLIFLSNITPGWLLGWTRK